MSALLAEQPFVSSGMYSGVREMSAEIAPDVCVPIAVTDGGPTRADDVASVSSNGMMERSRV